MENTNELSLKIQATCEEALKSLDKLISTMTKVDDAFSKVLKTVSKNTISETAKTASKDIDNMSIRTDKAYKSLTKLFTFAGAKRLISTGLKWMEHSMDYSEALNLFNVVLDESTDKAIKFQNTMNEAFGTNMTETLTRQGLFQSMAENMGIASDYAYIMSENTTKLVNDISSLYNKKESTVAEALRAGIYAGQTKPLRSFGMDITEKTLQPELDRLGIDRTVRELSQAEKQLLRYISVLRQSREAQGDWANTIEAPANQLKIFKNQLVEAQKALANLFINSFAKILPYANAILMVIEEVANAIASMFGIEITDYNTSIATAEDAYIDLGDSIGDATKKAKELNKQTLGFDQINNINEKKDSGSGYGTSGGIDQRLLDAIHGYDNGMDKVRMKAIEIRDRIMEWLGFAKEIDPLTGKISFKLKEGYSNLKLIVGIVETISASFVGLKLFGALSGLIGMIAKGIAGLKNFLIALTSLKTGAVSLKLLDSKFKGLANVLATANANFKLFGSTAGGVASSTLAVVGAVLAIAGALIYAYNTNDEFKEKVQDMVSSVLQLVSELAKFLVDVASEVWEVIEPIWNIIKDTLVAVVVYAYESCVTNFSNIIDIITGFVNIVSSLLHGDFKGAFDFAVDTVSSLFDNWKNYFTKIKEIFDKWIEKLIKNAGDFATKFIEKLGKILTWISNLPEKFLYWFGYAIGMVWKLITETDWIELGKKILNGIVEGLKKFGDKISSFASDLFKKVKDAITNIDWISLGKAILDGIVSGMKKIGGKLKDWGDSFVDGIKDALGIHSPARLVIDAKIGNYTTEGILVGMEKEIPSLEKQAKNMITKLKTTFDSADYSISMNDFELPSLNKEIKNKMTFNSNGSFSSDSIRKASYEGFVMAIQQYGLVQVNVDAKTDEGTILKTTVKGIQQHVAQTGELPFTVPA